MIPFKATARRLVVATLSVGASPSRCVHILAGHGLADNRDSVDAFRSQLKALHEYADFVSPDIATQLIRAPQEIDRPKIAFTFDDGLLDCYTAIAPVLSEFNATCIFFINSGFIFGNERYQEWFSSHQIRNPDKKPMSPQMVRELSDAGFVIGAHTRDHVRLVGMRRFELEHQVLGCRDAIENLTGRRCRTFAWPYGTMNDIDDGALEYCGTIFDDVFGSDSYQHAILPRHNVITRRHFEAGWPDRHVRFFLGRTPAAVARGRDWSRRASRPNS
jgi:peptidoglycan/xylan/chitin deacetylase (PgdA/CDA1 family)